MMDIVPRAPARMGGVSGVPVMMGLEETKDTLTNQVMELRRPVAHVVGNYLATDIILGSISMIEKLKKPHWNCELTILLAVIVGLALMCLM